MSDLLRKKSPRAPSIPLNEAIEGATKIYEKEHRHAAPSEAVAQHLGYKSANNGAAVKAMASIRYYGLLERPAEGQLAVVKDFESFTYAPSPDIRRGLVRRWLRTPPVFADLLDKFPDSLPSDATLRFELIQRGFLPDAVNAAVDVFRKSVEFAGYYSIPPEEGSENELEIDLTDDGRSSDAVKGSVKPIEVDAGADRIPVRLPGGRRAWIEIPTPFYEADKERLKRQIDLLLTEEDETAR